MANQKQNFELIDLLWKLRRALDKHGDVYIHFKTCLDDPSYRAGILLSAERLNNQKISELVGQIREVDHGQSISRQNLERHRAEVQARLEAANQRKNQNKRRTGLGLSGWTLSLLLIPIAIASILYILDQDRFTNMLQSVDAIGPTEVSGSILESTIWKTGNTYVLRDKVFVESGVILTIEPGVQILGDPGSALIITRDGSILARGNATQPIVFTSSMEAGLRKSGDWGGVVLLGNAPINRGQASVEGISETDSRGTFGGNDPTSNCGVLEYVRIEFAGYEIGSNNELNGLTLGGCGNATVVRNVQVHQGNDDGVEVFGGTVDLKNILISHAHDDSLDWDMGWTGRVQFLIIQQHPDFGDSGFEADNSEETPDAEPVSRPVIYNATMVGSRNPDQDQRAMVIRRGSGGVFQNFLISGFPLETIDLRGDNVAELIGSNMLDFGNIALSSIMRGSRAYFQPEEGDQDDDAGFSEETYFQETADNVRIAARESLSPAAWNLNSPSFTPAFSSTAADMGVSPPGGVEFWDESAKYLGAIRPGATNSWIDNWTAFPAN